MPSTLPTFTLDAAACTSTRGYADSDDNMTLHIFLILPRHLYATRAFGRLSAMPPLIVDARAERQEGCAHAPESRRHACISQAPPSR